MPQLKAQDVDWRQEARQLSIVIADIPDGPRFAGLFSLTPLAPIPCTLDPKRQLCLRALHDTIALHLAYRINVVHGHQPTLSDGTRGVAFFDRQQPDDVRLFYGWIASMGVDFTPADESAIDAQWKLQCVLANGWISADWKRDLPLAVAEIGGITVSGQARARAAKPRRRTVDLRDHKIRIKKQNPGANWKELLDLLTGDKIVNQWDSEVILWTDDDGSSRKTATTTFQKWKAT